MKKLHLKTLLLIAAAFLLLPVFGHTASKKNDKNLIVFFSLYGNQKFVLTDADSSASRTIYGGNLGGNTEIIARMIQEEIGGDVVLIETENKFSNEYNTVVEEGKHTKNSRFKATKTKVDLSKYDNVFIGFPAWWYDMPDPTFDFLEKHDLSGKKVFVFCTHGGSGLMRTISEIQKIEPKADVCKTGFDVYYTGVARAKDDVVEWLKKVGAK